MHGDYNKKECLSSGGYFVNILIYICEFFTVQLYNDVTYQF